MATIPPEWLSSTYKRYKTDTNTFTSWLTESAIDLDYQLMPPDSRSKCALEARSKCRDWYKTTFAGTNVSAHSTLEEENQGHGYFIGVLVDVLDTLKPKFEAPGQPELPQESQPSKSKPKPNVFELLEVENCVDINDVGLADLTLHRPNPTKKTTRSKRKSGPEAG
ncbi:hypothetical protein G7Y89_g4432 [Cudoniella acicularis]|uniref:DUF6604 domain-containing protein n=1 Tax=Cudoniella acicularis TaxID=354080 RepID=A0A8H4RPH0_9HELO|nr:hypothetical protein G7Y89_g4432 [Cudoniella acicularis]